MIKLQGPKQKLFFFFFRKSSKTICFPLSLMEAEIDLHPIEGTMILRIDTGKAEKEREERERERERETL